MPDVDEERPFVGVYPSNVDGSINLLDIISVKTTSLVAGVLISAVIFFPIYLILNPFFVGESKLSFVTACLMMFAGLAVLIAVGRNGDSLPVYVMHMILFYKTKRISIYNPRVKSERKSFETLTESQMMALKAGMLATKIRKMNEKMTLANFSDDVNIPDQYIFDDDIKFVEAKQKEELELQKNLEQLKKKEGKKKDGKNKNKKKKRRKA